MRIGIFSPTLHRIGGGEYVTIVLINALKEQGHNVVLLSNKRIDSPTTEFFFGKKLVVDAHISPLFNLSRWLPPARACYIIRDYFDALRSYVLKLNCQILIDTFSDFILPWTDITYFQQQDRNPSVAGAPDLSSFLYIPLLKPNMIEAKTVLVVSGFLAHILERKGIHCSVLYPPVDVSYFSHGNEKLYSSKEDVVVTISRFSQEKKLENIPLIAKLSDKNISFIIAGSCQSNRDYRVLQSLHRLIRKLDVANRVKLLPNISREKLRTLSWNSKVYLHTRENEPFGITIIEAMSSGCIPIVHNSGGPREFVPEHLGYITIEEAVMKIEKSIFDWSLEKSEQMLRIANKFNEKEFSKKFLDIVDLHIETQFQE